MTMKDSNLSGLDLIRQRGAIGVVAILLVLIAAVFMISFWSNLNVFAEIVLLVLLGGVTIYEYLRAPRGEIIQYASASAMALAIGSIVFLLRGTSWQVDTYMMFCVALAGLAIFCNWRAICLFVLVASAHQIGLAAFSQTAYYTADWRLGHILFQAVLLCAEGGILIIIGAFVNQSFASAEIAMEESQKAKKAIEQLAQKQAREDAEQIAHQRVLAAQQSRVVQEIEAGLIRLADGNLKQPIESPESNPFPEAYDGLRLAYNKSLNHLDGLMVRIDAVANAIRSDSSEIERTAQDLASRALRQADVLEDSTTALDKMISLVSGALDGAEAAEAASFNNETSAAAGGKIVGDAVQAMQAIEQSSSQINRIISVLEDIAFQTNLLALNAGVEAARAGEAGRGFAVVASEVRGLAERASDSAREIRTLISQSTEQVASGSDLVGKTGAALFEIVEKAAEVRSLMNGISSSSREQSAGLDNVKGSISNMEQLNQKTVGAATETSKSACNIARQTDELIATLTAFLAPCKSGEWATTPTVSYDIGDGEAALGATSDEESGWGLRKTKKAS